VQQQHYIQLVHLGPNTKTLSMRTLRQDLIDGIHDAMLVRVKAGTESSIIQLSSLSILLIKNLFATNPKRRWLAILEDHVKRLFRSGIIPYGKEQLATLSLFVAVPADHQ
jgi:hypothetical protein